MAPGLIKDVGVQILPDVSSNPFEWSEDMSALRRSVWLRGELDLASGRRLAEAARTWAGTTCLVELDMSGVSFVDCAGLAALVFSRDSLVEAGSLVRIVNPSAPVERVLALLGMTRLVDTSARASVWSAFG